MVRLSERRLTEGGCGHRNSETRFLLGTSAQWHGILSTTSRSGQIPQGLLPVVQ